MLFPSSVDTPATHCVGRLVYALPATFSVSMLPARPNTSGTGPVSLLWLTST